MSTIIEALKKAEKEPEERLLSGGTLWSESPYDRRTVELEQRQMDWSSRLQIAWTILGALGGFLLASAIFIFAFNPNDPPREKEPAGSAAVANAKAPAAEPTPDDKKEKPEKEAEIGAPTKEETAPPVIPFSFSLAELPEPIIVRATQPVQSPQPAQTAFAFVYPDQKPTVTPAPTYRAAPTRQMPAPPKTPKPTPKRQTETYVLQGTIWDETNPCARINGRNRRQGDQIGMAKVVRINPTSVILEVEGKQITLRQNEEFTVSK